MEDANLSVEEIKRQLDETENRQAELNRILKKRRKEAKVDVIRQIRKIIEDNGYEYGEILPLIQPKNRREKQQSDSDRSENHPSRYYVDPENPNNTYVRGVLPGWMKKKMQELGYDPSSKDDRIAFKTGTLRLVEA